MEMIEPPKVEANCRCELIEQGTLLPEGMKPPSADIPYVWGQPRPVRHVLDPEPRGPIVRLTTIDGRVVEREISEKLRS